MNDDMYNDSALMLFLSELEHDGQEFIINIDDMEDLLAIHCKVYIASQFDVHLGYFFEHYLKGPYSIELSNTVRRINNDKCEFKKYTKYYKMKKVKKARLNYVKYLFEVPEGMNMDKNKWLSLLSAILFLYEVNPNFEFIVKKMNKKNIATKKQVEIAFGQISKVKDIKFEVW